MLIVIGVQITHDILFYLIFSNLPRGFNKMLDLFKDYAKEASYQAVVGDSIIMVITVLFSSLINKYSMNLNIISLISQLYLTPYILFYNNHNHNQSSYLQIIGILIAFPEKHFIFVR